MQTSNIYSKKKITREEINIALQEYLENGGTIEIYPPQIVQTRHYIPMPMSAYEDINELSFF